MMDMSSYSHGKVMRGPFAVEPAPTPPVATPEPAAFKPIVNPDNGRQIWPQDIVAMVNGEPAVQVSVGERYLRVANGWIATQVRRGNAMTSNALVGDPARELRVITLSELEKLRQRVATMRANGLYAEPYPRREFTGQRAPGPEYETVVKKEVERPGIIRRLLSFFGA